MSGLFVFLAESARRSAGVTSIGLAAVGFDAAVYNDRCSTLYAIKKQHFAVSEVTDAPLVGSECFGKGNVATAGPAVAAGRDVLSLLERTGALVCVRTSQSIGHVTFSAAPGAGPPLAYERLLDDVIDACAAADGPPATLHLPQTDDRADERRAARINELLAGRRAAREALMQVPLFNVLRVSAGLQVANLVAYLAAQDGSGTRPDLGADVGRLRAIAAYALV